MHHKSLLLAACLSFSFAPPAFAQTVTGSGVVPATAANSAERAIGFAVSAAANGALVIGELLVEQQRIVPLELCVVSHFCLRYEKKSGDCGK